MAGLRETTEALSRYRRDAAERMAHLGPRGAASAESTDGASLTVVSSFGADPGALKMLTYSPPGLPAGAPLVVVLHGCTQTAQAYAAGAGWIELADRCGFALLCPEQSTANNGQRCFNWFEPGDTARGAGEAASIRAMIEHALVTRKLDRTRVFVTGLSAGGAMTAALLAAYPEVFAGGAIVAGLPYGAAHGVQEALAAMFQGRSQSAAAWGEAVRAASPHRGRRPRVSIWHGDADHTVQPSNLEESAKQWTDVHGLSLAAPAQSGVAGRDRRRAWTDSTGAVVVESHMIAGMGHGAPLAASGPDGVGAAGPFLLEVGVSSSLEIARFWGLTDATAQATAPAPPTAAPATGRAVPEGEPLRATIIEDGLVEGVEAVIRRALKAAGLIKNG